VSGGTVVPFRRKPTGTNVVARLAPNLPDYDQSRVALTKLQRSQIASKARCLADNFKDMATAYLLQRVSYECVIPARGVVSELLENMLATVTLNDALADGSRRAARAAREDIRSLHARLSQLLAVIDGS
jgi:hypothetical protein